LYNDLLVPNAKYSSTYAGVAAFCDTDFGCNKSGLLILNVDIDIDSINDTFGVSISVLTILLGRSIDSSINDNFNCLFDDISMLMMLIKF